MTDNPAGRQSRRAVDKTGRKQNENYVFKNLDVNLDNNPAIKPGTKLLYDHTKFNIAMDIFIGLVDRYDKFNRVFA